MAGNSNSGNRTARRGKPLPKRITLAESNARRLMAIKYSDLKNSPTFTRQDAEVFVNLIIKDYLDTHYPES